MKTASASEACGVHVCSTSRKKTRDSPGDGVDACTNSWVYTVSVSSNLCQAHTTIHRSFRTSLWPNSRNNLYKRYMTVFPQQWAHSISPWNDERQRVCFPRMKQHLDSIHPCFRAEPHRTAVSNRQTHGCWDSPPPQSALPLCPSLRAPFSRSRVMRCGASCMSGGSCFQVATAPYEQLRHGQLSPPSRQVQGSPTLVALKRDVGSLVQKDPSATRE